MSVDTHSCVWFDMFAYFYVVVRAGCAAHVAKKMSLSSNVEDGEAHMEAHDHINTMETKVFLKECCVVYAVVV
jgi:hypothetical protein|eukprot:3805012-Prymnesium_polylepis.1